MNRTEQKNSQSLCVHLMRQLCRLQYSVTVYHCYGELEKQTSVTRLQKRTKSLSSGCHRPSLIHLQKGGVCDINVIKIYIVPEPIQVMWNDTGMYLFLEACENLKACLNERPFLYNRWYRDKDRSFFVASPQTIPI